MDFIWIIVAAGVGLLLYMWKEAFSDRVIKHELSFVDFPKSFGAVKIFFISDVHRRLITDALMEKVDESVDIVIIGGDLAEKGVSIDRIKQNLTKLKKLGPVYFVWGNNDYELDHHQLDAVLLESGIKILDNTAVQFESANGETIQLLGVDDPSIGRDRLDLALKDAGKDVFKILASHNPNISRKIDVQHNIRLVLSGHTHGGQIRILGYSPYKKGGIRDLAQTKLFVSNGYGTTALPLRLGAKAETHLITLKSE
ncbi:metallophosphoesterase [Bacillus canaveralius]|uniref:Metallophosphoesterase n=1 Tax=Bacillus canaveralius TaxID=1403243 RepID=A0A2N5GRP1_9BACI|nr:MULTISPECIES: metallophosphoesterase [Bacillus]PLR84598.1 metallophosphoesterase [Bacillus sp. V33-4]PLR86112.1 metallophosphoesterase [Bacillus canaveralius]PLS00232.1 metallophosphoesterase [Bacillus canaveralius]RSK52004.1 metallophosphoesterase [Bacillus canaveralius]